MLKSWPSALLWKLSLVSLTVNMMANHTIPCDQVLESPELVGMLAELGLPYDRVVQLFDEADIDGDGVITFEEVL